MATKTTAKTVKKQETTVKAPANESANAVKAAPVNEVKTAPVKASTAPVKKAEPKKAEPKKEEPKKAEAKKAPVKKAAVKKEIKVTAVVEYFGKQVEEKDIVANVKKAWTKSGRKIGDIKTMELYIKPEEDSVYYVINDTETGAVAF